MAKGQAGTSGRGGNGRGRRDAYERMRRWGHWYYSRLTDRSRGWWRQAYYAAGGLAGAALLALVLIVLYALILIPFTPSTAELSKAKAARPTVVLSAGGEVLTLFERLNREWVGLDEISPAVADALIATEDHRFYEHGGIDLRRMIAAGLSTLAGDRQGGSTITQQLARNLYPDEIGRSITLTRKLKEIITAFKIESAYTKHEIFETYLNSVPFLYNVHGIELAAQTYFGTTAAELDVLQAATLVGMLKGTSYYNPVRSPERSVERRNVVLRQMVRRQKLSQEEFEELREAPIDLDFQRPVRHESKSPHFTAFVRQWATEWADQHGYDLYSDGLALHTTLDLELQRAAMQAVARQSMRLQRAADEAWSQSSSPFRRASVEGSASGSSPDLLEALLRGTDAFEKGRASGLDEGALLDSLRRNQALLDSLRTAKTRVEVGFVALDPHTGHVKAWVGSRSFDHSQYDRVSRARRQPGSTFKPFVYARALEEGFSSYDTFRDQPVEIPLEGGGVWRPTNADGLTGRAFTLRDALVHSKNTVTAQLIQEVGPEDVADLARRMGVNRSELQAVPSLALGTSEVTLLEMTSAYATFARAGTYVEPKLVASIEDSTGAVIARFETELEDVLDESVALRVLDMMRGVIDEGTGRGIRRDFNVQGDLAGKTGTTQHGADGWFILIHPELVSGAWVGFDDPRVTFRSNYWGQGAHNALFVVGDFAQRALGTGALPRPPVEEERRSFPERVRGWFEGVFGRGNRDAGERDRDRDERERRDRRRESDGRDARQRVEKEAREWVKKREEQAREAEKRREEAVREAQKRSEERERETRKRAEERLKEAQKRAEEREREAGKKRQEQQRESERKVKRW